ncbi:MAG: tetratricopeptide repeat protein [Saprospiraceae bacterium]|nr:tetratricopeptide repeat protein [Candidatus Vicinibacter affinis]
MNFKYLIIFVYLLSINFDLTAQSSKKIEYLQLINEGDISLRFGLWEQAILQYGNAIAIDPNFADAYMKRAVLLRKMGRLQESLRDYNQAINLNPYSIYLYDQRAKLKILAMDYKGAIDDINQAISINPDNKELVEHRADDYILIGDYKKAITDLDTLIALNYNREFEYLKKATIYFNRK